jgi:hypothetical protein
MKDLQELAAEYEPRNVLNMDETGLFWKQSLNRSLPTVLLSGRKRSKDRITLTLTSDTDGSEKFAV